MAAKRDKRARELERQDMPAASYVGRRRTILALFACAAVALAWRAFDQQILEKDFLQSEGADRYLDRLDVSAHRGLITDRRGEVLALSTPVDTIAANPRVLRPDNASLAPLARALDIGLDELRDRLARYSKRHSVYLRRGLPPSDAAHVMAVAKAQGIRGVHVEREYKRYYPSGEVFAHVVGFTDIDDVGKEGLELAYDQDLSGKPGAKLVLRDGRRQVVDDVENIQLPHDGKNLALSIDQRLQFIAYRELKAAVQQFKAASGSLVLLDARSGEILAMANQPAYNPNGDRSGRKGRLRNRAVTDVFEPGSTMKPFAIAAALELGKIKADSMIDTSPGYFKVGRNTVRDKHDLGLIDVATVLRKSSNVGAGKIALSMDKADYWRFLDTLGFGQQSGIGFPGEANGQLAPWQNWAAIDQASIAYGYSISVSTLQLAQAYAALANDGVLQPTSLLKLEQIPRGKRVFSIPVARAVRAMLEGVATDDGTAPQAAVPGYRVAGKTGTVKKLMANGYADDRHVAVFVGMAPATDARLVLAVMIDDPGTRKYYGGQLAGPVFAKVMGESLRLLNIRPDVLPAAHLRLAQAEAVQ